MCTARVINRHWKGKVHVRFGVRTGVKRSVRRGEHLLPPLHGLPTSCVFVPRRAPVMGAWPRARFSKNVLFGSFFHRCLQFS